MLGFALVSQFGLAQELDCGGFDRPIVFAGLDWDSALIHNAVAREILETGYGCESTDIPGSTIPMFQGMIRGDIDVTMEIWPDNLAASWDDALEAGEVVDLGINFPDSVQGFYVPTYVIEGDPERDIDSMAPDLESVFDLPEYAELFTDPEQPDRGRFYNCVIGWACEEINTRKLEAYGLDEHFTNFPPGSGEALAASLASAYARGEPWFGYYWGPTWVLGAFDMTLLEEPEHSEECWETDFACAYPTVPVLVSVSSDFYQQAPAEVIDFLENYETTGALTSELLAYAQDHDAQPEEAAVHFLRTQPEVWTQWVPAEVAERIQAALE